MRMRLSTRLTCYFLAALAVVLVGFSATLYVLASQHLYRQADERLESALNTLAAAAEIGPEGVEWERQERSLSFGRRTIEGQFHWRVGDDRGERLDGSPAGDMEHILAGSGRRPRIAVDRSGVSWRVMARSLDRPRIDGEGTAPLARSEGRHASLLLGAALSLEGVQANLRNLAMALIGLSLGVWTPALVSGRWLCRRALRPVTEMAEAAHAIGGDDLDERLPAPETDDEMEELGRSFNALLDRLRESFERQRRFTGDASHQLRTPLTAMQGQVDLAMRQVRSVEEYRRVLALVQKKTRHLRQIVEGLLFLARADAEAQRPELQPIEMGGWLREHLHTWTGSRREDVRTEAGEAGPLWVRAQPSLLGELLDNLLDNAGKYSDPGTPIRVRLVRDGDRVRLAVEDEGVGIEREDIPHVFVPFFRSEEARRMDSAGLGLGLSVAARLADVFGGRLDAESRPGRGSIFSLVLPAGGPAVSIKPLSTRSSAGESDAALS